MGMRSSIIADMLSSLLSAARERDEVSVFEGRHVRVRKAKNVYGKPNPNF